MGVTVEQMRAKKMRHLKSYKALAGQIEETRKNTGMSIEEYDRIYVPQEAVNNCCFLCSKSVNGCNWSKRFQPVKGWIAAETRMTHSYKIFWCPEFDEEKRNVSTQRSSQAD